MFLPTEIVEDYNVTIDGRNFSHQPIKNDIKTNENIQKVTANRGDDYTTGSFLDYSYLISKKNYKMIAIDLSKRQALDVDTKAIQQINFTGNLSGNNNRL